MGFDKRDNLYLALRNTATGQIVLICAGALPGYWLTVFTVDKLGRKPIQIGGFAILTIIFCVLGFAWKALSKTHLLILYVLAQFFFNFGPNATTFITPAEIFPTRVRSTGHGFSAGMGKLGAVFAQIFFAPMIKRGATHDNPTPWIHGVMQIFALFMFLGILTSFLVPESKRESLETLAGEKEDVYEVQASAWRTRSARGDAGGDVEAPAVARVSGSAVSGRSSEGIIGDGNVEKGKWWRLRHTEVALEIVWSEWLFVLDFHPAFHLFAYVPIDVFFSSIVLYPPCEREPDQCLSRIKFNTILTIFFWSSQALQQRRSFHTSFLQLDMLSPRRQPHAQTPARYHHL
jgi:PHS family inorganic phosphate transporter-like MFS transporter